MISGDPSSTVGSEFDKLRREFDCCLAELLATARSAASTTIASWRAIVEAMTGEPAGVLPPAGAGANPAEVRLVLLAVQVRYDQRLHVLERAIKRNDVALGIVDADAIWAFRHRRLAHFVKDELAAYIDNVIPKPSVGAVFAKAASQTRSTTTAPPTDAAKQQVQLHRCKTCAAPRLGDGLYGRCVYCGHPFFTGRVLEEV